MGSSSSTPVAQNKPGFIGDVTFETIKEGKRYVALKRRDGGTVHCLGVNPSSSRSVIEARVLAEHVNPAAIYVDIHPEMLRWLEDEVKAASADVIKAPVSMDTFQVEPPAEKKDENGFPIPTPELGATSPPSVTILTAESRKKLETPPSFSSLYTSELGLNGTAELRQQIAQDQLFRLLGLSQLAPYLSVLEHAVANKTKVIPYPISLTSANTGGAFRLTGSYNTIVGAPPAYSALTVVMSVQGVPQPDVSFEVGIPAEGFFSYDLLRTMRKAFIEGVNAATEKHDIDNRDSERLMRETAPDALKDVLHMTLENSAKQSAAIAYELQTCDGPDVVALVDIGRVASLERAWTRPVPAGTLFPEPQWYEPAQVGPYIAGTGALSLLGYATYRGWKRFPKTTIAFSMPVYAMVGTMLYAGVFRTEATSGSAVRQALANPKQPFSMF